MKQCSSCGQQFEIVREGDGAQAKFCPFCGYSDKGNGKVLMAMGAFELTEGQKPVYTLMDGDMPLGKWVVVPVGEWELFEAWRLRGESLAADLAACCQILMRFIRVALPRTSDTPSEITHTKEVLLRYAGASQEALYGAEFEIIQATGGTGQSVHF